MISLEITGVSIERIGKEQKITQVSVYAYQAYGEGVRTIQIKIPKNSTHIFDLKSYLKKMEEDPK